MAQNINVVPSEPELADLLNYWSKQIKLDLNCHHVGTIELFNPLTQTAQVSINYAKTRLQIDDVGDTTVTTSDYPILLDCPCVVYGGGTGYLSFPIAPGDECLVMFNDRDMDAWFAGSSSSAPETGRLHAFTDAIAMVGIRSLANVIPTYSSTSVVLDYLTNKIELSPTGLTITYGTDSVTLNASGITANYAGNTIQIGPTSITAAMATGPNIVLNSTGTVEVNNTTGELMTTLNALFQDIQTATVNTMFGPQPLIMPSFAAHLAIFDTFKN